MKKTKYSTPEYKAKLGPTLIIIGIIFRKISMSLPFSGIKEVLIDGILVTIVYNMIFVLLFFKKDEFRYLRNSISNIVARRIKSR